MAKACVNMLTIIIAVIASLVISGQSQKFNYKNNTEDWEGVCQTGTCQSPIDLRIKLCKYETLPPIRFIKYNEPSHIEITNNNHTVDIKFDSLCPYYITGGGFRGVYRLDGVHHHISSEHTIYGKRLPGEFHFVHRNDKYPTIDEALKHPDGIAVLGAFLRIVEEDNPVFKKLLPSYTNSSMKQTPEFHLAPIELLPEDRRVFYRYFGSLTTPPCIESVTWTVFKDTIPISARQYKRLTDVYFQGSQFNSRPVQKLCSRTVSIVTTKENKLPPANCSPMGHSHTDKAASLFLTLAGVMSTYQSP